MIQRSKDVPNHGARGRWFSLLALCLRLPEREYRFAIKSGIKPNLWALPWCCLSCQRSFQDSADRCSWLAVFKRRDKSYIRFIIGWFVVESVPVPLTRPD